MTWEQIRGYAEEVELWTTLAINVWLILGAFIFLRNRVRRAVEPMSEQAVLAAMSATTLIFMVIAATISFTALRYLGYAVSYSNTPLGRYGADKLILYLPLSVLAWLPVWRIGRVVISQERKAMRREMGFTD